MKTAEKKVNVYSLSDPRTKEIKYIGATTSPLNKRLSQHICNAKYRSAKKDKWLKSLKKLDLLPICQLLEVSNMTEWQTIEKKWLKIFKDNGNDLTNTYIGGSGMILNRNRKSIMNMAKKHRKAVLQLDNDNTIIKEWEMKSDVKKAMYVKGDTDTMAQLKRVLKKVDKDEWTEWQGFQWIYKDLYKA